MNHYFRHLLGSVYGLIALSSGMACSSGDVASESSNGMEGALVNGSVVRPWAPGINMPFARSIVKLLSTSDIQNDRGFCTGTIVQPSWVLSARHCTVQIGHTIVNYRTGSNQSAQARTVDAVIPNPHPSVARDTVMIHVSQPFTGVPEVPLFAGRTDDVHGQTTKCFGYGANKVRGTCIEQTDCLSGEMCWNGGCISWPSADDNEIRVGTFTADARHPEYFVTPKNSDGQIIASKDSGGPCFIEGALAGVISSTAAGFTESYHASVPISRESIRSPSRVQYTPGDFNGDGKTDVIITLTAGSFWYLSTGRGTWDTSYQRTDLPLGKVQFTTGNFNGTGGTDVIVTTNDGSSWMTLNGTWSTFYNRPDLPLGTVQYTVGNFNNAGGDDAIITLKEGSWWYAWNSQGQATVDYARPDLTLGNVAYTAGNFDGQGGTDVIITIREGSWWYYSTGTGTWDSTSYVRTDLPLGKVQYTAGNFDGTGGTDLVITIKEGSWWYYSTGRSFNQAHERRDLTLGFVQYTPGNFDGVSGTDLIITIKEGSWWYYSTGAGWTNPFGRTDLGLGAVQYTPGRFDADALEDVIITIPAGSWWYYSDGVATFDDHSYFRTDLPL
jgi:hypothetical protein